MGAAVSVPVDIDAAKAAAGDSFDQHKWDAAVKDGQGKVSAELFNAHVLVSEADGNDGKVTANGRRLKKPLLGTRSALPARGRTAAKPFQNLVAFQPPPTKSAGAPVAADDQAKWCINGGDRHDWHRWHKFTPIKKYRCGRAGCGFFKKCWLKCEDADTTCGGCHVIGHKRW
jgi:hypothetical protein